MGSMTDESRWNRAVTVAITGASGARYALRLIERLGRAGRGVHLLCSDAGRIVLETEEGLRLAEEPKEAASELAGSLGIEPSGLRVHALLDWFAPVASGSAGIRDMVVVPCSMGTLARIASGASDNLIERAADVMLKERGRLILVPRETPLSAIHLENMLKLARMGALILPAMPGFYHRPEGIGDLIDFVVDRILDHLGVHDHGGPRWGA